MAAHEASVASILAETQAYASQHAIPALFESILLHIVYNKPRDVLGAVEALLTPAIATKTLPPPALPGREVDTLEAASSYLREAHVEDILQQLVADVLAARPAEPLGYIAQRCAAMKSQSGSAGSSRLFTDENLAAMHALYDPSGRGSITPAQVATAFRNLGLKAAPPAGLGLTTADAFVKLARQAIDSQAA